MARHIGTERRKGSLYGRTPRLRAEAAERNVLLHGCGPVDTELLRGIERPEGLMNGSELYELASARLAREHTTVEALVFGSDRRDDWEIAADMSRRCDGLEITAEHVAALRASADNSLEGTRWADGARAIARECDLDLPPAEWKAFVEAHGMTATQLEGESGLVVGGERHRILNVRLQARDTSLEELMYGARRMDDAEIAALPEVAELGAGVEDVRRFRDRVELLEGASASKVEKLRQLIARYWDRYITEKELEDWLLDKPTPRQWLEEHREEPTGRKPSEQPAEGRLQGSDRGGQWTGGTAEGEVLRRADELRAKAHGMGETLTFEAAVNQAVDADPDLKAAYRAEMYPEGVRRQVPEPGRREPTWE